MDKDSNAREDQEGEAAAGEQSGDFRGPSILESLAMDTTDNPELPERRGHEADNGKVCTHARTLHRAPSAASCAFWRHPD
jgi:hypothetical protein